MNALASVPGYILVAVEVMSAVVVVIVKYVTDTVRVEYCVGPGTTTETVTGGP